jgi:hypothetical protein
LPFCGQNWVMTLPSRLIQNTCSIPLRLTTLGAECGAAMNSGWGSNEARSIQRDEPTL